MIRLAKRALTFAVVLPCVLLCSCGTDDTENNDPVQIIDGVGLDQIRASTRASVYRGNQVQLQDLDRKEVLALFLEEKIDQAVESPDGVRYYRDRDTSESPEAGGYDTVYFPNGTLAGFEDLLFSAGSHRMEKVEIEDENGNTVEKSIQADLYLTGKIEDAKLYHGVTGSYGPFQAELPKEQRELAEEGLAKLGFSGYRCTGSVTDATSDGEAFFYVTCTQYVDGIPVNGKDFTKLAVIGSGHMVYNAFHGLNEDQIQCWQASSEVDLVLTKHRLRAGYFEAMVQPKEVIAQGDIISAKEAFAAVEQLYHGRVYNNPPVLEKVELEYLKIRHADEWYYVPVWAVAISAEDVNALYKDSVLWNDHDEDLRYWTYYYLDAFSGNLFTDWIFDENTH